MQGILAQTALSASDLCRLRSGKSCSNPGIYHHLSDVVRIDLELLPLIFVQFRLRFDINLSTEESH